MKGYLEHKKGFLNYDESSIYFTDSGNWSDTIELKELGIKSKTKNFLKIVFGIVLFALIGSFILGSFLSKIKTNNSLLIIFGFCTLCIGIYKWYNYFIDNNQSSYKIQITDITDLKYYSNSLMIKFKTSVKSNNIQNIYFNEQSYNTIVKHLLNYNPSIIIEDNLTK